jgi:hypothetical protein
VKIGQLKFLMLGSPGKMHALKEWNDLERDKKKLQYFH